MPMIIISIAHGNGFASSLQPVYADILLAPGCYYQFCSAIRKYTLKDTHTGCFNGIDNIQDW